MVDVALVTLDDSDLVVADPADTGALGQFDGGDPSTGGCHYAKHAHLVDYRWRNPCEPEVAGLIRSDDCEGRDGVRELAREERCGLRRGHVRKATEVRSHTVLERLPDSRRDRQPRQWQQHIAGRTVPVARDQARGKKSPQRWPAACPASAPYGRRKNSQRPPPPSRPLRATAVPPVAQDVCLRSGARGFTLGTLGERRIGDGLIHEPTAEHGSTRTRAPGSPPDVRAMAWSAGSGGV